jgi:hypothetical protein
MTFTVIQSAHKTAPVWARSYAVDCSIANEGRSAATYASAEQKV